MSAAKFEPHHDEHPTIKLDDQTADCFPYHEPDKVRVSAGETLALLLHAARTNRSWLNDFAEETLEISRDMYEVLLAYKRVAFEENSRAA